MTSSSCWKCLLRPSNSQSLSITGNTSSRLPPLALSFSTSTSLAAAKGSAATTKKSVKAKAGPKASDRGSKTLRLKKKAFVKSGRPPNPGERKAIRKRIVLSNTNALEVQGMVDMSAELDATQAGKVLGLPGPVVDQLRAVDAFKTTQGWGMFRRPGMLIREKSVEMAKIMEAAETEKKTTSTIIGGERGAGKSMMLVQAMATAFMKGWIVLHVPEAQELTMGVTDYAPVPDTEPIQYSQNTYAATWLGQITKANSAVLSQLQVTLDHKLPFPLPAKTTLARLAELGAREPETAWPVFQAFWSEITSKGRPPILWALDGLHHIMKDSAYRSPEYEPVHAHDLAIVKLFVDLLSGTTQLPNGGAVLAATTTGNNPLSLATALALKQHEERQAGKEISMPDPFEKIDLRAYNSLQTASFVKLSGLSKAEARGLMEYWAASGVLRQRVDEKTVAESWALAGNGIVGEIERGVLRMRI